MLTIEPAQLARFESLGDNCELGFVLRHLGADAGSLLKWARSEAPQVVELLACDFVKIFEQDALSPFRSAMVQESRYGIQWHSILHCHVVDGRWQFVEDAATRAVQYQHEARKMRYLVTKLRARLAAGGVILVVKSNAGIDPAVLSALQTQLQLHSRGARNTLLEVCAARSANEIGEVVSVRPGVLRGFVARFAPYEAADDIDFASWKSVLAMALMRAPCSDWQQRSAGAATVIDGHTVSLNFPATASPDPRGGTASLSGGNEWCRVVDERFRLHAAPPGQAATTLTWQGVQLPPMAHLSGMVSSAIEQSVPVQLTVSVAGPHRAPGIEASFVVSPGTPAAIALDLPAGLAGPACLQLAARATRALGPGERAVVDISLLSLERHQRSRAA